MSADSLKRAQHLALAFGQLPGLIRLDGVAAAVARVAEGTPPGELRDEMTRVARRIEGGASPSEALASLLPAPFAAALADGDDGSLLERLELVGNQLREDLGTAMRVRAATRYPALVASFGALVFAFSLWSRGVLVPGEDRFVSLLLLAVFALMAASAFRAQRTGSIPRWASFLPGAGWVGLRRTQRVARTLALLMDERTSRHSPEQALAVASAWLPEEAAQGVRSPAHGVDFATLVRRCGLSDDAVFLLSLGASHARAGEAAERVAARLEARASGLSRTHLFSLTVVMLASSVLALMALPLSEAFPLARLLGGS